MLIDRYQEQIRTTIKSMEGLAMNQGELVPMTNLQIEEYDW